MAATLHRRRFLALAPVALAARAAKEIAKPRAAPTPASAEARGAWIHPSETFDADPAKGKEQVRAAVRRLADAHFNLILPWTTVGYLTALEHPEYLASNPTARWDVIGFLIEEAARAGMAVHLWYAFTEYRSRASPDFDPRVGGNPRWAARRIDELLPNPRTGKVTPRRWEDVCPQHPLARLWQLRLLQMAFKRYPLLKGMHVEEPGYTYLGNCVCDLCLDVFPKLYGKPLPQSINSFEADDFRTVGTTAFMSQLYQLLQADYSQLVYSTNGAYDWRSDRKKGRDWASWAGMGWLGYYAPQIYVNSRATFRKSLALTLRTLNQSCATWVGIGVRWSSGSTTVPEVISQIEASREMGVPGVILFLGPGDVVSDELYRALLQGPFRLSAPLPLVRA